MGTPSPEKRVDQVLREEPGHAALIGGGGWGPTLAAVNENLSSSILGVATNTTNLQSSGQARIPIPHLCACGPSRITTRPPGRQTSQLRLSCPNRHSCGQGVAECAAGHPSMNTRNKARLLGKRTLWEVMHRGLALKLKRGLQLNSPHVRAKYQSSHCSTRPRGGRTDSISSICLMTMSAIKNRCSIIGILAFRNVIISRMLRTVTTAGF